MSKEIKKLCNYMIDCVKYQGRSNTAFNNLKSNKNNKIVFTPEKVFNGDDKRIVELLTAAQLNKDTMSILYCDMFLIGKNGKNEYFAPVLYADANLIRAGDKIVLETDGEMIVNIGMLASLFENELSEVENIINQILEIENPEKIDFEKVLRGLIPGLEKMTIRKDNALILAKTPDNIAGILTELKKIAEKY